MERSGQQDQDPARAASASRRPSAKDEPPGGRPCAAGDTGARYQVKRGDTLWEIATAHGVTVEELREWNDLRHQAKLVPGQVLRIGPSGS